MIDQEVSAPDMMTDVQADMKVSDPIDQMVPDAAALPSPGWLDVELTPGRTFYRLGDEPSLSVVGYNVYGELIEEGQYRYRITPPIARLIDGNGQDVILDEPTSVTRAQLQFIAEGSGDIETCVMNPLSSGREMDICVTRPFTVDDSAPQIKVFWPPRGATLAAQDAWPAWSDITTDVPPPETLFNGMLAEIPI
jgi:hypothetical protein